MRIFKVRKQGIIYKVYRQNGREFNPATDRVMKTWDGIGTYMKRV